jgi:hypothetical protein
MKVFTGQKKLVVQGAFLLPPVRQLSQYVTIQNKQSHSIQLNTTVNTN